MTAHHLHPRRFRRAGAGRREGRQGDRRGTVPPPPEGADRAHRLARPLLAGADGRGGNACRPRRLRPGEGRRTCRRCSTPAFLTGGQHSAVARQSGEDPVLRRQTRLTFARCGITDPLSLDDYEAHGGLKGLRRRSPLTPAEIVKTVTESGLRGRGGAGFPTGIKWKTVLEAVADRKYIVCNADEGDSATFADRMIMEGDPFVLIEGMAIAGIAVGATKGFVYIRSEYPHAVAKMAKAVAIARKAGLLGVSVLGSPNAFDIEIRVGAGAYVCGEETSLLNSLEGKRGVVRAKPPLPAIQGLFGKPTVINNVISLASVPIILDKGPAFYKDFGMGRSRGTIPIQIAGNVKHGGLFEAAFGMTLGEIVDGIGGGTATGRPVKAVQVGGPLGAYFPRALFDTPFDYEAFAAKDGLIGHAGITVFDDTADMLKQARFAMEFCAIESCGKCTPCRIGSTRGVETIDKIGAGIEPEKNLALVTDLCNTMKFGSLCALGGFTPYPVMSAINHFPEDFAPTPVAEAGGWKGQARPYFLIASLRAVEQGRSSSSPARSPFMWRRRSQRPRGWPGGAYVQKASSAGSPSALITHTPRTRPLRRHSPRRGKGSATDGDLGSLPMGLIHEIDYGTPASKAEKQVTLTVDGFTVTVPEGTSIMRASMEAGIAIPKLCATDMVDAFGSCRLCLVEIEGRNGTPSSCTTPVAPGMVVHTQTGRLKDIRKGVMELYISDHPLDCLTCAANGDCELQDMAGAVGLRDVRYGYEGDNHVFKKNDGVQNFNWMPKDESNPYFTYDPSKCIVCSRCVRACEEVQGTFALTIEGRGFGSRVSPGMHQPFIDSECVSCGACVQACPTATLTEKSVIEIGQPEHSVVTTCAYCGVGCSFKAEMRGDELVRMVPWKDGKANRGHSCVKGRFAYGYATHKERILNPMVREKISDPWREVSWDEAFAHVARSSAASSTSTGKGSIGGITSSRCTNEETYLVQKLIRQGFGNNNVDTCARVCHSPTGYGLGQTYGTSAGTQDFDSVEEADVIMVIGANPAAAHPVFASRMKKRLRQGAKLIVLDPRRTEIRDRPSTPRPTWHLPLKPGTNVAVVTALAHVIVTEGLFDEAFIRERCDWSEFEDWAAFVAEPQQFARGGGEDFRRRRPRRSAARRGSTPPAATARSTTASASPSTARARRPSWRSPTSPWRPAISAGAASA